MGRCFVMVVLVLCSGFANRMFSGETGSELAERLEDPSPEKRRSAVRALAKVGDYKSWKLVLGALGDPEGQVSDQAQLALGKLDDARVLKALLSKSGLKAKEPALRRRAAECLGRVRLEVDGSDLVSGLNDRDGLVRRRLLWSIERLAKRELLTGKLAKKLIPAIERRWQGDREPGVRAAALQALNVIDSALALELSMKGLDDRRVEVRLASLSVAGQSEELIGELRDRLMHDSSARVRSQLIEVFERCGNREGARALVQVMDADPRIRLRWSALDALHRISGMKYRMKLAPWKAWSERLPRNWRATRHETSEMQKGASRAFGGMPLISDRVAFLFDLSGSLWRKREDGTTRKEYADKQLKLALHSLPEGSMFNVIPYTKYSFPWREELVKANDRNIERAYKDFEGCTESGQGNFFDAALLALQDPNVDTIVALTDGAPTGGEIWSLDLMIPMLLEHNRFQKVRFDTILVDAPKGLHRHWESLAKESGGRVISIEANSR
ncbi:MAG: HEAT repeat protein [Planctomycetota bacterium]|jgi:HEAT repeat protein